MVICKVALEETGQSIEDIQLKPKVGDIVKARGPLKVYHVPKMPEFDIGDMEGVVNDYVGLWKGKLISANFSYKVQFNVEVDGRPIKFHAHLKEE